MNIAATKNGKGEVGVLKSAKKLYNKKIKKRKRKKVGIILYLQLKTSRQQWQMFLF